ncbi:hypothetical protein M0M42_08195 [Pseudomonas knackmussii]|uniref:Uncharacterized protein n=1 Tax=Pseudomonas knackmussii TaxID=65741 RepID=A0ABY4KU10_9PSED|nr:hypothetical protein [Pseudomonas knackmussii]UPQ84354.1 hypothetical protein M0M42_08195 [Pseudomonas knackmussii]
MQDETVMFSGVMAANDPDADAPLPGDPEGASINDAPMSELEETELTDEDIDMFEDDPTILTE